ncbi:hypothetical protein EBR66_08805 [bacterium]|nr:hypothetical protein [bacterium]
MKQREMRKEGLANPLLLVRQEEFLRVISCVLLFRAVRQMSVLLLQSVTCGIFLLFLDSDFKWIAHGLFCLLTSYLF